MPASMMDKEEEAITTTIAGAENSTEGSIISGRGSNIGEEEEKIEEDVIADRLTETQQGSSGSGQLKTPEDGHDGINDTSDMYEEKKQAVKNKQNDNEATSTSPQEGTTATSAVGNINAANEHSAVSDTPNSDGHRHTRSYVRPRSRLHWHGNSYGLQLRLR